MHRDATETLGPTPLTRRHVLTIALAGGATLALPVTLTRAADGGGKKRKPKPLAIATGKGKRGRVTAAVVALEKNVATVVVAMGGKRVRYEAAVDLKELEALAAELKPEAKEILIIEDEARVVGKATGGKDNALSFDFDGAKVAAAPAPADDDNPPEAHAIGFMTGLVIIAAIMGTVAIFGMLTGKKVKFEVKLGNAEMKVGVEGGAPTPGGGESGRDEEDSDSDGSGEPDPAPDPGDGGDGDGGGGSDSGGGADN